MTDKLERIEIDVTNGICKINGRTIEDNRGQYLGAAHTVCTRGVDNTENKHIFGIY